MGPTHVQNEISWNRKITCLIRNYLAQGVPVILTSPTMAVSRCFDEEDNADGFKRAVEDGLIIPLTLKVIHKDSAFATHIPFKLVIMDYCTVRTIMTRAGKTFPPGLGWKIREFSAWPNRFCVPRHVWILQGRSIKREEWDERRGMKEEEELSAITMTYTTLSRDLFQ